MYAGNPRSLRAHEVQPSGEERDPVSLRAQGGRRDLRREQCTGGRKAPLERLGELDQPRGRLWGSLQDVCELVADECSDFTVGTCHEQKAQGDPRVFKSRRVFDLTKRLNSPPYILGLKSILRLQPG